MKIAHFVPIGYQTWPPQTILVSDWLISKKSSSLRLLCLKSANQKQELPMAVMFANESELNEQSL
jgi:hypothetical protein